ncbi:OsmC family protein [Beggiatoa leptomitoformis]|uniref:Osmotically inducible protein OsmC n=1 Tax=Beggiatoa leptomitoformis TaxID=288004 RepID=A0A2N9YDD9_9GAMM|nr:OsmC family protein [Beggiatoa leptomitoformis]ALG69200.1 osmotically inducible protein OsmC [Beggiatoa leptomitoformis]AUI68369.1 osmotically inducible protein OsmC [Beggiatoa leptomitoformis]
MDINVHFGEGLQVITQFDGFTVQTDQPIENGGQGIAPDPFSYFLSSLAACAGFFVLRFCQSRQLVTDEIRLTLHSNRDPVSHRLTDISMIIHVPQTFPQKYLSALVRATNECSVKKVLADPPTITVDAQVTENLAMAVSE